jgi:hypothetical protein
MNTPTADEHEHDARLAHMLRQAWPGLDCPPPEVYLPDAELSDAERARFESHARTCPGCAAERALARSFEAGAPVDDDRDAIVQQLRDEAPWRSRPATVTTIGHARSGGRTRRRSFIGLPLAMAAGVLLAVGVVFQLVGRQAPPIGAPGTGIMRGSEIETVAPEGDIAQEPDALRWHDVHDAASYHVTILGVDGDPVWSGSTAASPAQLPDAALTAMHPTVLYRWQVEAMNANGQRIAWSKPTPFRFEAGSGDSPQE